MTSLMWIVLMAVAAVVAFFIGRATRATSKSPSSDERIRAVLEGLAQDLRAGTRPAAGAAAPPGMATVREALEESWASREEEREKALREALGRVSAFLRGEVAGPLRKAQGEGPAVQSEAIDGAVGALQDLEFFLKEPLTPDETHNLVPALQQVTKEFAQDWDIVVRLRAPSEPVRAHIHRGSFMDAVYLLLHNAGQFGGGESVDVTVSHEEGRSVVAIRDRGPGFTDEALEKAHDLFFTTTESGLGLGIPFARRIVESFGGDLVLRNYPEGGAEVVLSLPAG